jgi:hypothetical protein
MGLAANLVILGGLTLAGGAALAGGSKMWRRYFVKSSDEYYEKRKQLLVSGTAVRSDIDATKERAVDAYARLLAFEKHGHEGKVKDIHLDAAKRVLEKRSLEGLLEKIETTLNQIDDARDKAILEAQEQGADPSSIGSAYPRDIVREVVMDTMPVSEVVDPFESMLRPTPAGPSGGGDPGPA